ncbi:MAG TPA: rod shape-determining protein MreC [Sedimentisphaerales bacterium]|nr:rod shape-determining protein MreC [Sedimentisphaerales bacterium]
MARKLTKVSERMLFTYFTLAGLIVFFAPEGFTSKFQLGFAQVFRRPLGLGRSIYLSVTPSQPDLVADRSKRNYVANLEIRLEKEREKLEDCSGLRQRLPLEGARLLPADVTAAADRSASSFFINRGKSDGLAEGQFVLGENSIVGTIDDVLSRSARVKLITDPDSAIGVKIESLNLRCFMRGKGNGGAAIEMVGTKHKVKTGQKVYAAPHVGLLDDYIIAGEITACGRDQKAPWLWDITVEPVCDIEQLYDVDVIIMDTGAN